MLNIDCFMNISLHLKVPHRDFKEATISPVFPASQHVICSKIKENTKMLKTGRLQKDETILFLLVGEHAYILFHVSSFFVKIFRKR